MPLNTLHCIIFSDCFLQARFSALFGKAEVRIVVIDRYRRKQRKRRCLGGNGGGGGGAVGLYSTKLYTGRLRSEV